MKSGRRFVGYIICVALGAALFILGCAEIVDEYWCGMGSGLLAISIVRMIQMYRLRKDEAYREKVETETKDERNHFLRGRAWGWAGYLFILIAASASIILRVIGQELLSLAASYSVCLIMILFWISYLILKKKY